MLFGKKIIVGVSASIAAYKAAYIIRLLIKEGAEVKVVMTPSAKDFITPLTLSTLSKNPVFSDYADATTGVWNNHVDLALWADAFVIAPSSANTLAKMANGICDNLLLATYLSAKCKVFFAPAMDLDMFKHPSTVSNINKLVSYGHIYIKPNNGELASGLYGEGRMAEPEEIIESLGNYFDSNSSLKGKHALVTAGPTYEAIDPVRFIGNHSSGKMGVAIAEELAAQGALVTLVCGPSAIFVKNKKRINRIDVVSAEEMFKACVNYSKKADVIVMAAAVADFKPEVVAEKKIKKNEMKVDAIALVPTIDILAELGKNKKENQLLVGFALETDNELENAKKKIKNKNLDFIVLNSLNDKGAGFKGDENKITIIDKKEQVSVFELKSKTAVAKDIVDTIVNKK